METVILSLMLSSATLAEPAIRSVEVVSDDPIRIRPCEPLFLLLTIEAEVSAELNIPRQVQQVLTRNIVVRNEASNAPLYDGAEHPGATLFLNEGSVEITRRGTTRFDIIAVFYWNSQDNVCLFDTPGRLRILFGRHAKVGILVQEPTDQERIVIRQMQEQGADLATFIMGFGDRIYVVHCVPDNAEVIAADGVGK